MRSDPAIQEKIDRALFDHLALLNLPTSGPNVGNFAKPTEFYVEAAVFKTRPERLFLKGDADHRHRGFFQVLIRYREGVGPMLPGQVATRIVAHFPPDFRFLVDFYMRVIEAPHVANGFNEEARYSVPVTVQYEAFG